MEVSTVERRRNLLVCETEAVICDKSLLTTAETEKVAGIEKEQNQVNCETGTETCDYSLLTPMEAGEFDCSSGSTIFLRVRQATRNANQLMLFPVHAGYPLDSCSLRWAGACSLRRSRTQSPNTPRWITRSSDLEQSLFYPFTRFP